MKNRIQTLQKPYQNSSLSYAIVLPGRKSAFRAGLWPDCYRESTDGQPEPGRRANFSAFPVAVRQKYGAEGRFTNPEALLRNME